MALDEATSALLTRMAASDAKPLQELTATEAREAMSGQLASTDPPPPEMHRVDLVDVPTDDGTIPVRMLHPTGSPRGVLVYYHGGGWVLGSTAEFDELGRTLAARTGCSVAMVEYRLAPEHRHPAAVEDCWAALRWADREREELPGGPVPLLVAGDSAGGNLAAVISRRAAASGGPLPSMQILIYPVTDCDFDTGSYTDPRNQLVLTREGMTWFWDHYVPEPQDRLAPEASPLRADDLSGLPETVVLTAEHDVLRDEGEAYAERLRAAGVRVHERRFEGQTHGFLPMIGVLPGSAAGLDYIAETVDGHLTGQDS
ncbi:acetyl esterase [Actinopolyspora biskrensis]|uniref:Acetyl esterase n=1 Tax=Actinopolyspora biskrensis TaxID=1470178 RepID=A0A852YV66_9ACTN|nr:alpha/beta hydrolase [Actinopolyspora biskrensis]NYH79044.1 acetyl esterase [Actinopolyspora biskrensis]